MLSDELIFLSNMIPLGYAHVLLLKNKAIEHLEQAYIYIRSFFQNERQLVMSHTCVCKIEQSHNIVRIISTFVALRTKEISSYHEQCHAKQTKPQNLLIRSVFRVEHVKLIDDISGTRIDTQPDVAKASVGFHPIKDANVEGLNIEVLLASRRGDSTSIGKKASTLLLDGQTIYVKFRKLSLFFSSLVNNRP